MNLLSGGLGLLGRSNAAAGFSPLSLNPFQWLSASYGMEKTAGVPAVNGDLVLNCLDKSGNSATASQPTSANRATYSTTGAGGRPGLTFAGSQYYRGSYPSAVSTGSFSLIVVAGLSSSTARSTLLGLTLSDTDTKPYQLFEAGLWPDVNQFSIYKNIPPGETRYGPNVSDSFNLAVWSVMSDNVRIYVYKNGALLGTAINGNVSSASKFIIGSRPGNGLVGVMAESLVFRNVLSDTNHTNLVNYFKEFYSIS